MLQGKYFNGTYEDFTKVREIYCLFSSLRTLQWCFLQQKMARWMGTESSESIALGDRLKAQ